MNSSTVIFKRELKSFLISPMAYIVITVFLITAGWFFFSAYFLRGQASMRQFFSLLPLLLTFTIPALTMRTFSEEFQSGSYELLATLPASLHQIVIGKFLGTFFFSLIMLSPTLLYSFFVSLTGDVDIGPIIGGYLGSIFLIATLCSLGIFMSTLTKNQIVSYITTMALCFFLYLLDNNMLIFMPAGLRDLLRFLSTRNHFNNVARGVLDSRDLLYFFSVSFIALYASTMVLKERR